MSPSEYFAALTTKRGIIAAITIVALLGAGIGSLPPSSSDLRADADDTTLQTTEMAPEPAPTATTRVTATTADSEPTTERAVSGETSAETRTSEGEAMTTETESDPETTTTSSGATWDVSVSDDSERFGDPPEATVRATGNATVAALPTSAVATGR